MWVWQPVKLAKDWGDVFIPPGTRIILAIIPCIPVYHDVGPP